MPAVRYNNISMTKMMIIGIHGDNLQRISGEILLNHLSNHLSTNFHSALLFFVFHILFNLAYASLLSAFA